VTIFLFSFLLKPINFCGLKLLIAADVEREREREREKTVDFN